MANGTFAEWKNRLLFWGVTAAIAMHVGWAGWVTSETYNSPDREETILLIESHAPYVQDRAAIKVQLDQSTEVTRELATAMDRQTEAITALKIEIARMGGRPNSGRSPP